MPVYFSIDVHMHHTIGEAGSVAVLPRRCAPMGPVRFPVPALYVHLVSSPDLLPQVFSGYSGFPPASKTGLLK